MNRDLARDVFVDVVTGRVSVLRLVFFGSWSNMFK
jgi:hypothetical protein